MKMTSTLEINISLSFNIRKEEKQGTFYYATATTTEEAKNWFHPSLNVHVLLL
jgi:hypothetical protein